MRVALLDLRDPRHAVVDKTIAGGLGTASDYGDGLVGGALLRVKAGAIRLLSYHVAYAAAQLRARGHLVTLHDRVVYDCDVAVLFTSIPSLRVDRDALAAMKGRVRTVVVGTLAGVAPEEFADADVVVKGEPEAFFAGDGLEHATGTVDVGYVDDLDALPTPDWSIFQPLRSRYWIVRARGRVLPVVTSRGCPYPCGHYCPYPLEEGKRMRYRSTGSVVDELRLLRDRYGVTAVKFRDPILTIQRDRAHALCDALAASPGTIWGCETHLDTLDEPLLRAMAAAGCVLIQTGVESTSRDVLQANRRRAATDEHTRAMLQIAEGLGIRVAIYFMLGLPGDTLEGMRRSLAVAPSLPASYLQITVATPYPGTSFWDETADLRRSRDLADFDQYSATLGDWSDDDLRRLMGDAYRRFYLRPGRLAHELRVARGRRRITRSSGR